MVLTGVVNNGVVVLEDDAGLPNGTQVEVYVPDKGREIAEGTKPTLLRLMDVAGSVTNLPADFASQHDHYIHGSPKR